MLRIQFLNVSTCKIENWLRSLFLQKLYIEECPKTQEYMMYMGDVPYSSVVGILMYAMICYRHDISHVVGVQRIYISTPRKEHQTKIKRVFRYLLGIIDYATCYQGKYEIGKKIYIHGFFDFDWVGISRSQMVNQWICFKFIWWSIQLYEQEVVSHCNVN